MCCCCNFLAAVAGAVAFVGNSVAVGTSVQASARTAHRTTTIVPVVAVPVAVGDWPKNTGYAAAAAAVHQTNILGCCC